MQELFDFGEAGVELAFSIYGEILDELHRYR